MNYQHPDILDPLAGRYVTGALRGPARQRFERLIVTDAAVDRAVRQWEQWLQPLAEAVPPIDPPDEIWARIERDIDDTPAKSHSRWWLGLSWLTTTAVAVAAIAAIGLGRLSGGADIDYLAAMATSPGAEASVVVSARTDALSLVVDVRDDPALPPDTDLELWAVSRTDGEARSLGLVSRPHTRQTWTLTRSQARLIRDAGSLLLTVEPAGGSPIGEPDGDVYAEGLCIRVGPPPNKASTG